MGCKAGGEHGRSCDGGLKEDVIEWGTGSYNTAKLSKVAAHMFFCYLKAYGGQTSLSNIDNAFTCGVECGGVSFLFTQ